MSILDGYRPEVRRALPALVTQRWLTNIGVRVLFTFLPNFARGTGLTIEEMGQVLTLRDLTGLAAPAMGRVADRRGTGPVMAITSTIAGFGLLFSVFSPIGLVVGFVLMGLGKIGFDVALNAWVGNEVAYERRARAFGIVELTWAGAALVGLPLCGLLIDHVAWWSVPVVLSTLTLLTSARLRQVVDRSKAHDSEAAPRAKISLRVGLTMLSLGALNLASQLLFVSHGIWLEGVHGLSPSELGLVVILFGIVEAIATLTITAVTDRLGKRRSVLGGSALLLLGTTALATVPNPSLVVGLTFLALGFLGFEFAFVSSLPLVAELDPNARAQIIGMFLGFGTIVRAGGSIIGTKLYVGGGITNVMTVAAVATIVAILGVVFFVHEPVPTNGSTKVLN